MIGVSVDAKRSCWSQKKGWYPHITALSPGGHHLCGKPRALLDRWHWNAGGGIFAEFSLKIRQKEVRYVTSWRNPRGAVSDAKNWPKYWSTKTHIPSQSHEHASVGDKKRVRSLSTTTTASCSSRNKLQQIHQKLLSEPTVPLVLRWITVATTTHR